jgi:hypothetical protein
VRPFRIAGDVAMGLILGVFLYAAAKAMWAPLGDASAAAAIVALSVLAVLFRKPNGSLRGRSRHRRSGAPK